MICLIQDSCFDLIPVTYLVLWGKSADAHTVPEGGDSQIKPFYLLHLAEALAVVCCKPRNDCITVSVCLPSVWEPLEDAWIIFSGFSHQP